MKDLKNIVNVVPALTPTAAVKATVAGATVDSNGYDSLVFSIEAGATQDTLNGTNYYEVDIQHSTDGSTWSAAADAEVQYAVGTANGATNTGCAALFNTSNANPQVVTVGILSDLFRYFRVNLVVNGTMTNGTNFAAVAVLSNARHQPAGQTQLP